MTIEQLIYIVIGLLALILAVLCFAPKAKKTIGGVREPKEPKPRKEWWEV